MKRYRKPPIAAVKRQAPAVKPPPPRPPMRLLKRLRERDLPEAHAPDLDWSLDKEK